MTPNEHTHRILDAVVDYLRATPGPAPLAVTVSLEAGQLNVHFWPQDERGGCWTLRDGLSTTACDHLREVHGHGDDQTAEDLIAAALATLLFARGVANPVNALQELRERRTLTPWLRATSSAEAWRDFAEAALLDLRFPPQGPSPESLRWLRSQGWTWGDILARARANGYAGTKGALRAREYRRRKRDRDQ